MSRRTLDTEIITIRQVNALTPTNSFIPALTTLTSDGKGGTFWAIPSSLGGMPAINQVVVDNLPFPQTSTFNTLYLSTTQGMGSITNSTTNLITLYSKGFTGFDISGGNMLTSFSNSILSPTIKLVGRNGVKITGDPLNQTLFFDTQTSAISTGIYGYSQINMISNASTVSQAAIQNSNRLTLSAGSVSTILNLVGVGDIVLNGNSTSNSVFLTISTFNSAEYLNISSLVRSIYPSTLSTVSTLFSDRSSLITSMSTNTGQLLSTSLSFQTQIQNTQNTMMDFYTNLDLYKLLSTSLRDTNTVLSNALDTIVSYSSSINTSQFTKTYEGTVGIDQHISFSSIQFRLDSVSSLINEGAQFVLTYSPSMIYNFLIPTATLATVSTFIKAGDTTINEATFVRPWFVQTTNSGITQPYLYTDTMKFVIRSSNIMKALDSTFTIYHHVDVNSVSYPNIQTNAAINYLTPGQNTLAYTLTGMNY
jgi:hypothetical protein